MGSTGAEAPFLAHQVGNNNRSRYHSAPITFSGVQARPIVPSEAEQSVPTNLEYYYLTAPS